MTDPTPSRPRRILTIILELVLVLALIECGADVLRFVRKAYLGLSGGSARSREVRWEPDDYLRGRIVPGQKDVLVSGTVSVASFNSLGFRDDEPRPAAHRIVCLGDSVTFGWGASTNAAAYPAVLEKRLARGDVDVLNAGMPRWNSCDLMDLYVTRIVPLRPDVLVILAGWNDLGNEMAVVEAPAPSVLSSLGQAASESSSSARILGSLLARLRSAPSPEEVIRDRESAKKDAIHWERFDEYERILASTAQLARANGSQPVLVTLPNFLKEEMSASEKRTLLPHLLLLPDVSLTGWRRMVLEANGRIRKVARDLEIPLAECEHSVASTRFIDLCHFNDAGYADLASCVARTVGPLIARP